MVKHYLKIAFRNLWKYKVQNLISSIGLAVGFICFALSVLWIRYERSYDSFHEGADRLYLVEDKQISGISQFTPNTLASYLKETFPEIEDACNLNSNSIEIEVDYITREVYKANIDSSSMRMLQIKMISGSLDFLNPESSSVAITDELSKTLWGNADPLGKQIKISSKEYTVCAIVKSWPNHSNFYFQILEPINTSTDINIAITTAFINSTLIRLKKGINVSAFKEKIHDHKIENRVLGAIGGVIESNGRSVRISINNSVNEMLLTPLASLHYEHPIKKTEVEYKYIFLVALSGGLLILCSLFNYLTLFFSRFRIRIKELALRIVNGASGTSLFVLLSIEFVLTLIVSLILGLLLIQLSIGPFRQLSNVNMSISAVYGESLLYIGAIITLSLFAFFLMITVFRLQSLNVSITRIRNSVFRKTSVILQLIISIGFVFCTVVIVKQVYFSRNMDVGFDYKNTAEIKGSGIDEKLFENQLQQIPEIVETLSEGYPLFSIINPNTNVVEWEDMPQDNEPISVSYLSSSEAYTEFYNFRLIEGEFLTEHSPREHIMINEAAAKAFGWHQPVGKTLNEGPSPLTVKGVIKDFYISPTVPPNPIIFRYNLSEFRIGNSANILIKYHDGQWNECKKKIEQLAKQEYPNAKLTINNAEETYNDYMKSEVTLMKLLSFVSFVCIIISVFGLFSLVSLTCEERRKGIAIRKINGASIQNILTMFFREYFMLLVIGAVIAFPIGYFIMRRWLELYVKQTSIDAWVYLSILLVLTVVITLCVGWRVYKTSRENPAEVVKSE